MRSVPYKIQIPNGSFIIDIPSGIVSVSRLRTRTNRADRGGNKMTGNKPDETDSRLDLIVARLNVMAEEMEWMKEKLIRFQNALDILTGRFE